MAAVPVLTELDPTITFDADLGIVDTNSLNLANTFGASQPIRNISADDPDGVLSNGDGATITTDDGAGGTDTYDVTYLGDATLTTAAVTLGSVTGPLATGFSVQVNPLEGELVEQADGSLAFISEEPVNDGRIGVTLTTSILGASSTVTLDLADLDDYIRSIPALGPLLGGIADLGQFVLDTAVVTIDADTAGTLVVCFARGTRILTRMGTVAVEDLRVGDQVFTRDNGYQAIRWIGANRLTARQLARQPNLRPIRIAAGALGGVSPSADLLVSPQHRILVCSPIAERMFGEYEVLVAAKQLVGCEGITVADDVAEVEYFHFLMDRHEVVFSNGAATESLFTGAQALKSLSPEAVEEIRAIFPVLLDETHVPRPARHLPQGRRARTLGQRHRANRKPLFAATTLAERELAVLGAGDGDEAPAGPRPRPPRH